MEKAKSVPSTTTQIPKPPNRVQSLTPRAPPAQNKKRRLDNVDIQNSPYFKIRALVKDVRPFFMEVLHTPDFRNSKAAHEIRKKMKLMIGLHKQMMTETISVAKCENISEHKSLSGESMDVQKPEERHQMEKQAEHPKIDWLLEKSQEEKHGQSQDGQKSEERHQVKKQAEHPKTDWLPEKSQEEKHGEHKDGQKLEERHQVEKQAYIKTEWLPEKSQEEKHPSGWNYYQNWSENSRGTYIIGGSPPGWNFIVFRGIKKYPVEKQARHPETDRHPEKSKEKKHPHGWSNPLNRSEESLGWLELLKELKKKYHF